MKELLFFDRCFWCLEDFFSHMEGVLATEVGYANGNPDLVPAYYEVGKGNTGYEEVCRVFFDEERVSVHTLCTAFFQRLNPARRYTEEEKVLRENQSKVLFVDYADREAVICAKEAVEAQYQNKLLTQVEPLSIYYRAEEEHQHYFARHPEEAACAVR